MPHEYGITDDGKRIHWPDCSACISTETLIALRTLAGLTQTGLSSALGVSRSTVARWETGKVAIPKWAELAMRSL
jgi:DNA-binding XRE family transcriptional regulator